MRVSEQSGNIYLWPPARKVVLSGTTHCFLFHLNIRPNRSQRLWNDETSPRNKTPHVDTQGQHIASSMATQGHSQQSLPMPNLFVPPPSLPESRSSLSSQTQYNPITHLTNPSQTSSASPYNSPFYRQHTLKPNNIIIEDAVLDEERWSRAAFAFGMPYGDVFRATNETRRFASKVSRKSNLSEKTMTELVMTLVQAATKAHKNLQTKASAAFHKDAVPSGAITTDALLSPPDTWSMPLPIPKPSIAVGFSTKTFTPHELELQAGIISTSAGLPCDLAKVSQPTTDVFWPFFTVDIQPESLHAAQNASAGSASTCNNALALLAEAADEPTIQKQGPSIFWNSRKAVHSFSLSVNLSGKVASLNLHDSEGSLMHHAAMIRVYRLDDERDVEALFSRLISICVWADNIRLPAIVDLLENLDELVKLESRREFVSDTFVNQDLSSVVGTGYGGSAIGSISPPKRFGGFKSVMKDISPRWLRVHS